MFSCQFFRIIVLLCVMPVLSSAQSATDLSNALDALFNHITGAVTLNASELDSYQADVINNDALFESDSDLILSAFEVAEAYESSYGPLWLNDATRNVTIPREQSGGLELEMAIIAVMQGLLDHAYTTENIGRYRNLLENKLFETSEYFPGACDPPANSSVSYDVVINASQDKPWGAPVMFDDVAARRPTGCYVAPGSFVTVTVPASLVNSGYTVRVGAHSWDLSGKPRYERLDRISLVFPITGTETVVANPVGGGIYIEVPVAANAGIVTVTCTNTVRSPFFSDKPWHKTTVSEWISTERNHPGPWADFESEKYMMQVPSNWIYATDNPDEILGRWDTATDYLSDLVGKPRIRNGQTVMYQQVDVIIKGGAYHPGYPMSNDPYDPLRDAYGNADWHHFVAGPDHRTDTPFHEMGHAELITKFPGETEAVVNLLHVAVMNQGFGFSLDRAFSTSMGNKETISKDQAAIMWMVTENFRQGNPMDITNSTKNEVRYQQRGYGKYVEIADLFGWQALNNFWYSVNVDYMNGIEYNRNNDEADSRILRMSRAAGADLRPLVHFWGVHPNNDAQLNADMQSEGLMPSELIYDKLVHYKSLIPMNNAEFNSHADIVYPERDGTGNVDYGKGWYSVWDKQYNNSHGNDALEALDEIINYYFPNGRPNTDDNGKVKVFILSGQSNMVGHGTVVMTQSHIDRNGGKGTLEYMVNDASQAPLYDHLVNDNGQWIERDDVWIVNLDRSGPLSVGYGSNEDHIGPEMQFGHVMGDYFDSQVLLIKVSWGGKSLQVDFRPPSSGGYVGEYYTLLIERVHEVLNNIKLFMPGYDGQGYELAGFGWHQGWNDRISDEANAEYQENCVNLINDLRDEFQKPDMPFVLATTGMSGWDETHPRALSLMEAQLAVPYDSRLKYGGNVLAVETRDFWRDADDSPADQGYHWNRSGETYFLIGGGMGEAMTTLMSPANAAYDLTVNNGSGDGSYPPGANVDITADAAPSGKMFDGWEVNSGNPQISNISAPATALRMPAGNVTVTAVYINDNGEYRDPEYPDNPVNGLTYKYYHGNWDVMPDFNALTPTKTGTVSNFDLSDKMQDDYFGFSFNGYVDILSNGTYTFYTNSDDGSKLYIGSTLVTDNDGVHGMVEKSGQLALKAGMHALRVDFFERAGGANLEVSYEGPGISKQLIPNNALYYNDTATSSDDEDVIPEKFQLAQNYPNPFNPSTTINYNIPERSHVSINVYDILGELVTTLVDDVKPEGSYSLTFSARGENGSDLPSGIYVLLMHAGDYTGLKKMMLIK